MVVGSKVERESEGGHLVSSVCAHSERGGRKCDRQGSLIEARIRPAFMLVCPLSAWFVPNLIGTSPPWPGRLPPLRRSAYRFRRCRLGCGCALGGCWGACAIAPRPVRRLVRAPGGVSIAPASPGAHTLMCSHNGHGRARRQERKTKITVFLHLFMKDRRCVYIRPYGV